MGSTPFITVIIPAFNAERYVAEAIDSVLRQTSGRYEIIVVDDGSTDQTQHVVRRYGDLVRYEHQHNAGPSTARNRAIELATGDMIAFLDADDSWHPGKSAVQTARLNARPELAGCAAHVQNYLSDEGGMPPGPHDQHLLLQQTVVTLGSTLIVRRSLFDAVGMLNREYRHRDLHDLMVRAGDRGFQFEILPDILAQRRIHAANMSHNRSGADQMELVAITRARHARRRAAGV